jgi:hypothetical protein
MGFKCAHITAGLAIALIGAVAGCKASVDVKANASLDGDDDAAGSESSGEAVQGTPTLSAEPPPGPPTATYPGFRVLPGGAALIRVEVTKVVDVEEKESPNVVVYRLKGARAPEKVNRLPLIAQHFPTRVSQVTLQQAGEDLDVVIELREPAKPEHRVIESLGQMILEVTIPPRGTGEVAAGPP